MPLVRRLARPLLASVFIYDGIDALRHADERVPAMDKVVGDRPVNIPGINTTADLVRADAAVKVAGGALTSDAFHMSAPEPSGVHAAHAIELALQNAGVVPRELDD